VVATQVVDEKLAVRLGGCNLGGEPAVRTWHQLAWLPLPGPAFWTPSRLEMLEATSTNGFQRPSELQTAEAQRQLRLEWAGRLAVLGVIAAVDAYYLLRQTGYEERVDAAAAMLGPEAAPIAFPMPAGSLADPAYHHLHEAHRQLRLGNRTGAKTSVTTALDVLAGSHQSNPGRAISLAKSSGRMKEWHVRLLLELADSTPRGIVSISAMRALNSDVVDYEVDAADVQIPVSNRGTIETALPPHITRIRPGEVTDSPLEGR